MRTIATLKMKKQGEEVKLLLVRTTYDEITYYTLTTDKDGNCGTLIHETKIDRTNDLEANDKLAITLSKNKIEAAEYARGEK